MQSWCADQQTKANANLRELMNGHNDQDPTAILIAKCAVKWGTNYAMIEWCFHNGS
jgi:hypothetical protein